MSLPSRVSLHFFRDLLVLLALLWLTPQVTLAFESADLSGEWSFSLDPRAEGIRDRWFDRDLSEKLHLPGTLQGQGFGNEVNATTPWVLSLYDHTWFLREPFQRYAATTPAKIPFLAQPVRHYLGAAWYQSEIEIPESWGGRAVVLFLERPRWQSTVWLDGKRIGSDDSLVAPHEFELGMLAPGHHRVSLRLDNREIVPGYRPDSHSVSDSLGSTWNGVAGKIELRACTPVAIDEVRVFTDSAKRTARVEVTLANRSRAPGSGKISAGTHVLPITWSSEAKSKYLLELPFAPDARPWSEFDPALQHLTVRIEGTNASDEREIAFGVRDFRTAGTAFLLNGREIHLRGTHHGGDFPLTGSPATDVEYWRNLFRLCRSWGLNHMRFHSWCPPEAAFTAADEVGFYLQPECGMWNDFNPNTPMEPRLYSETERLLRAYGNHPSFLLLSPSNEPGGGWKEVLPPWVAHFRAQDSRHLYTTGTGWSLRDQPGEFGDKVDYLAVHRIGQHPMRGKPGWFGKDYDEAMSQVDKPNLTHEVGQWCAYPDFNVIAKFTGYLRPGNYEIARDSAEAHGLLAQNAVLARASGRFQLLCYKEEIEANLRSKKLRGFQLLDLHDYLGQGTALVGLLDPFWEEKGYITAAEFRRFCGETVPLARLPQRVFEAQDVFNVPIEFAHFGPAPLTGVIPYWKINDRHGKTLAEGEWPAQTIPIGNGISVGNVSANLSDFTAPGAFRLVVGLRGTPFENDWNFWVYPSSAPSQPAENTTLVRTWAEAEPLLARGASVLWVPLPADLAWRCPTLDDVPIFWNRLMGPQWSRMLGLWCDPTHPALAAFPTESFCDWQWSQLVATTRAINLDGLPRELRPIVQPIDDWNRNYKLGLVFEARVGTGKLLVCAVDIVNGLERRPVARQLRGSLLRYVASDAFRPTIAVSSSQMRSFLFDTRIMHRLGAEAVEGGLAVRAIDGDPNTAWLSGRSPVRGAEPRRRAMPEFVRVPDHPYPHELTLRFRSDTAFSGVVLMPRQDQREHVGDVRDYRISISSDGKTWVNVQEGQLPSSYEPKTIQFGRTVTARFLKFTGVSGYGGDPTAALAELAVLYEGPPLDGPVDDGELRYQRARSATPEIDEGPPAKP